MNEGPLQPKLTSVKLTLEAQEVRCRFIAELKERVQQGLYNVSSQELAEKLLLTAAKVQGRTLMLCKDARGAAPAATRGGGDLAHDTIPLSKDCSQIGISLKTRGRT